MAAPPPRSRCDVDSGTVPPGAVGPLIVRSLSIQGFCVMDARLEDATLRSAAREAATMEFYQVNAAVAEGLLGAEGSAGVADLAMGADGEVQGPVGALEAVDHAMTCIGRMLQPHTAWINLSYSFRSNAVVHRTGDATAETPELTEAEVSKWQSQFMRHRIMAVLFLGPGTGCLQLEPYDVPDAAPFEIETLPGFLVLLCADSMSHRHFCSGDAYVLTCFFMSDVIRRRAPEGGWKLIPPARAIEEWTTRRLSDFKDLEGLEMDVEIPEPWRKAMNHAFHRGQMAGIYGDSVHQLSACDMDVWLSAAAAAPDYAAEVPFSRWNHTEWYDAGQESWMVGKTYCRHGIFMDGIEHFDNKFFDLSVEEAKELDPHQRLILEQGYSALVRMGMTKEKLRNANGGVFVGCEADEWTSQLKIGSRGADNQLSMVSGRLSFCCGMRGPAMTMTTEGASGLTASHMASDSVLTRGLQMVKPCDFAIAAGISLMLSPTSWVAHTAHGWLSKEGRSLAFDVSADGFVRGDGCVVAGVKAATKVVDGAVVPREEQDEFLGTIAGSATNNNGRAASLTSPHGPAEQDCMALAIHIAGVRPADVESIEANALGSTLRDAVEVSSHREAHRGAGSAGGGDPLCLLACKSSVGNEVEASGLLGLLKAIYSVQWGRMVPSLHLRVANAHIDPFAQPVLLADEAMGFSGWSSYVGVMAQGMGGTNAYVVTWSMESTRKRSAPLPAAPPPIAFWPGGGGKMEGERKPKTEDAYFIVGTWSKWENPQKMDNTGIGEYSFEVTLGENRWEQFQIWLDGAADRVLHPGAPRMPQGCPVIGPDPELEGGAEAARSGLAPTWIIDGRGGFAASEQSQGVNQRLTDSARKDEDHIADLSPEALDAGASEAGLPGDRYEVLLQVKGKWRMVTWEKIAAAEQAGLPAASSASYHLVGSWNDWSFQELYAEPSAPGAFTADVQLPSAGIAAFQIVRDRDWSQTFYPNPESTSLADPLGVLGPDDLGWELSCWIIEGMPGERYSVQFQRTYKDGVETRRVSWKLKAHDEYAEADQGAAATAKQ